MTTMTRPEAQAQDRYDALCDLIAEYGASEAQRVLALFDPDPALVDEAMKRWRSEHVTNVAGRVEGTILRDGPEYVATAECGPQRGVTRRFSALIGDRGWDAARHWLLHQEAP